MASCRMPLPRPIFRRSTVLYAGSPRRVDINESNFGTSKGTSCHHNRKQRPLQNSSEGCMGARISCLPPCFPPLWCPFDLADLQQGLRNLQHNKALPTRFAPARLWKDTAALIAPLLLPAMNLQIQALHPRWHEVQVCTLPKVHTVKLPKQVRPISLLHPCNKVLASLLAARVLPKVAVFLESVPQWAYLPGRSTADALEAVCSHLQAVRLLVQSKSTTLVQRHRGAQPTKLAGGVECRSVWTSITRLIASAMRS